MNGWAGLELESNKLFGADVQVAVIDSGIDPSHPLINGVRESISLVHNHLGKVKYGKQAGDWVGHGTACGAIILSHAPKVNLYSIRILDKQLSSPADLVVEAIRWCIKEQMDVVNLSLGTTDEEYHSLMSAVCQEAQEKGVILVAAEHSCGLRSYPAILPTVIGVGAADIRDSKQFFYREGCDIEFLARGNEQRLAWTEPRYIFKSGTSFAAPHITGIVAQIREALPGATTGQVREILVRNANPTQVEPIYPKRERCRHQKPLPKPVSCTQKSSGSKSTSVFELTPDLSWIKKAVIFPYGKEAHSLIRFRDILGFDIVDVVDLPGRGMVGKDAGEAIGSKHSGIQVSASLSQALNKADTLILGYTKELGKIKKRDIKREVLEECINRGKNMFMFEKPFFVQDRAILNTAQKKGCQVYWPEINIDRSKFKEKSLIQPGLSVPVVGVFGTSASQGKFTTQLALRRGLINAGYRVGQLGTEHHSSLFGMDACFPYGYSANVDSTVDTYPELIKFMLHEIEKKVNPHIIIVGSQSGTIPFDLSVPSKSEAHTLPTLAFLMGTQPDAYILTVNNIDPYEYIQDTVNALKAIGKGSTILLTMSDKTKEIRQGFGSSRLMISQQMSKKDLKAKLKALEDHFGVPATDVVSPEGEKKLVQTVIDYFSEE